MNAALRQKCERLRGPIARRRPAAGKTSRDGGLFGGGIIEAASAITRGRALGHDQWVDVSMLRSVADLINESRGGVKSRFTHPSMSGDGLGKAIGRLKRARVEGDQVLADLHLFSSASRTPDGDLSSYLFDLAAEDSSAFGLSIVYSPDAGMERAFAKAHTRKGVFKSPDPKNTDNLPHARIAELVAVDVVDSPAANPSGLFHRGRVLDIVQCERAAMYALGLAETRPDVSLDIHADRLRDFIARLLAREGYELSRKKAGPGKLVRQARARLLAVNP